LPAFPKGVKRLIVLNVAIYFFFLLLRGVDPHAYMQIASWLALTPALILRGPLVELGHVWQLVTYGFLHLEFWHLAFNMLTLWMFGGELEQAWGRRKFYEFYFFCMIGAALATIGMGYLGVWLYMAHPAAPIFASLANMLVTPTLGASGGVFGLTIAYAMLRPDARLIMFPLPFAIKARTLAIFWILAALAGGFGDESGGGVASFAHLGGALFGWLHVKIAPRLGFFGGFGEGYFGLRNRYYRWKRQKAAKKFEVYMRKQMGDDPPDKDKWVN